MHPLGRKCRLKAEGKHNPKKRKFVIEDQRRLNDHGLGPHVMEEDNLGPFLNESQFQSTESLEHALIQASADSSAFRMSLRFANSRR